MVINKATALPRKMVILMRFIISRGSKLTAHSAHLERGSIAWRLPTRDALAGICKKVKQRETKMEEKGRRKEIEETVPPVCQILWKIGWVSRVMLVHAQPHWFPHSRGGTPSQREMMRRRKKTSETGFLGPRHLNSVVLCPVRFIPGLRHTKRRGRG
jgi:hypothetical protein